MLVLLLLQSALAIERCDHGVSFSNGNTTKELTAKVTCKDHETGQLRRIVDFVEGQRHGLYIRYDREGRVLSEQAYVDDEEHGEGRYYRDGVLFETRRYDNGSTTGQVQTVYHPDGAVHYESVQPQGGSRSRWGFDPRGKLTSITCGVANISDRFKNLCNSGKVVKLFYEGGGLREERRYSKAKFHGEYTKYWSDGTVMEKGTWMQGDRVGSQSTFRSDGTLEEVLVWGPDDTVVDRTTWHADGTSKDKHWMWSGRTLTLEEDFWQNGERRQRVSRMPDGVKVETYHDNGQTASMGVYAFGGYRCEPSLCRGTPIGEHESFDEKGRRVGVVVYEDGHMSESRTYDDKGKLVDKEFYYPDGSRKR